MGDVWPEDFEDRMNAHMTRSDKKTLAKLKSLADAALVFAEHPDYTSIEVDGVMVPRHVWIDEACRWIDNGMTGDMRFVKTKTPPVA